MIQSRVRKKNIFLFVLPVLFKLKITTHAGDGFPGELTALSGRSCSAVKPLPTTNKFNRAHIVVNGDFIYQFGGRIVGNTGTKDAWKYDLGADEWSQIESLTFERLLATLAVIDDSKILIAGISSRGIFVKLDHGML